MIRFVAIMGGLILFADAAGVVSFATADPGSAQHVRTESGSTRCLIIANDAVHGWGPSVTCEYGPGFPQAPVKQDGFHYDLAVIDASGAFRWDDGNIGGGGTPQNDVVLNYGQTYHMQGWTILPSSEGTRFTNDRSGHGMFVSIDNVSPF